jgi:hydroxymethylglutaryl-CoA reductase (NADPH)
VTQSSFDPAMLPGNVEQFIGLAQIPIGIVGPVLMTASTRTGSSTSR